jgi:membrane-associated phospholipid phosphatase
LFPNFGAKSSDNLPQAVLAAFPIAVTPSYGDALLALSRNGVEYLTPKDALGLIGFPSFHTIMACMSVCFVPRHRILMPIFLCLNALMVPAILIQGGHYLIDMLGGIGVFVWAFLLSGATMRRLSGGYEKVPEPSAS